MTNSLLTQRVIFNTTDISVIMSDYRQGAYVMGYDLLEYLYIGTSMPMNNLYFNLSTPSTSSAGSPTIKVWFGNAWVDVVDIIDQTSGMTKSGRMSWSLQREKGWDLEDKSSDISGFSNQYIYDMYWLRMSWGSTFTSGISFIGQKFSEDVNLHALFPDLMQPSMLDAFKQGKTNWDEQHFMAAEMIVQDLRARNIARERFQVMDASVFTVAAVAKVAEIAYSAFGQAYADRANAARKMYNEHMSKKLMSIDENGDGIVDMIEKSISQGWIHR